MKQPHGPPMTLGNMREQGVQHLIAYCLNDTCRHQALIDVSCSPGACTARSSHTLFVLPPEQDAPVKSPLEPRPDERGFFIFSLRGQGRANKRDVIVITTAQRALLYV